MYKGEQVFLRCPEQGALTASGCCQLFGTGTKVCLCVGISQICCYSRDTGARENKALIFEAVWALWWEY